MRIIFYNNPSRDIVVVVFSSTAVSPQLFVF